MKLAASNRAAILDGSSHDVEQTLIAGTLDPAIAPDFAMDLCMTRDQDPRMN